MLGVCKGDHRTSVRPADVDSRPSSSSGGLSSFCKGFGDACRGVVHALGEALFPATCFGCGKLFCLPRPASGNLQSHAGYTSDDHLIAGALRGYLCEACLSRYAAAASPLCLRCGLPFESSQAIDHLCETCRVHSPAYVMARAAGVYNEVLKTLIHHFKYGGRENLARPLGRMMWRILCENWQPDHMDRIVPVPLHASRLRTRGFNQAYALAREWPRLAAHGGWRFSGGWMVPDLLERRRRTRPQTGLDKRQRLDNLSGAFGVAKGHTISGLKILLVDDVMTTGATVEACSQALLDAGAREVHVLTAARAVP